MKILIAYDSKTGTARECAELLGKQLNSHNVTFFDLGKGAPTLSEFDFAVIGGSIRFGKLGGAARSFLSEQKDEIGKMKHAFFICCAEFDEAEEHIKRNFDAELRKSAVICSSFGGELRPERHKGIEKLAVKLMRKSILSSEDINYPSEIRTMPAILPDTIAYFADKIKDSFAEN